LKRVFVPIVAATLGAAAVAAGCYGVLRVALPTSSTGQRLAIHALAQLDHWRSYGGVMRIDGRTLTASCKAVRHGGLLTLDDGTRVLVRGRRVRPLAPLTSSQARLLATARAADPEAVAAEAVLGGSRSLIVAGLAVRLAIGTEPLAGRTRVDGIPAYVFRLGRSERPSIELLVSQGTFEPLGVRYSSARIHGSSRLTPGRVRRLAAVGSTGC
jgi:hypothetical protein